MKITIIGCGNAGCTHAAILSEQGNEVRLLKTSHSMHDENFEAMCSKGGVDIENIDGISHFQHIDCITRDFEKALCDTEIIFVMLQSMYHQSISQKIAQYINHHLKMIIILPGNLGGFYFRQVVNNDPELKDVIIAEGESMPYDCRIETPGHIRVLFKNARNALSFLPGNKKKEGLEIAHSLIDTFCSCRANVLVSALHNPNLVVHTVGTIMSASRIEYSKGEFWLYREGFSPSIWNLINDLDAERNAVIKKYGGDPISYLDDAKWRNEEDLSQNSKLVFDEYSKVAPKGPSTIYSRYLVEDVQNGLVILSSYGALAGIKTPVCDSLITIASSLTSCDYRIKGKTPESFGFTSYEEICNYLND